MSQRTSLPSGSRVPGKSQTCPSKPDQGSSIDDGVSSMERYPPSLASPEHVFNLYRNLLPENSRNEVDVWSGEGPEEDIGDGMCHSLVLITKLIAFEDKDEQRSQQLAQTIAGNKGRRHVLVESSQDPAYYKDQQQAQTTTLSSPKHVNSTDQRRVGTPARADGQQNARPESQQHTQAASQMIEANSGEIAGIITTEAQRAPNKKRKSSNIYSKSRPAKKRTLSTQKKMAASVNIRHSFQFEKMTLLGPVDDLRLRVRWEESYIRLQDLDSLAAKKEARKQIIREYGEEAWNRVRPEDWDLEAETEYLSESTEPHTE
ncbi:hypothetical protein S7711_11568 [Stachybotrys chartarum IBT 7711]|uniref:Uncharacterized protein n=1 Tax=Stachybotrys chartarum (strain CBS 109288 / IBT 7711) TaxID=1280523 RepID=A0A084AF19_STACB|nr:hypothetical protein S7711_11568 [Stachybotrys chartarum IBT 7711]